MYDGLLAYFPAALAEVARCSKVGNDQHNPGEPLHWARGKSTDHANKILRHLTEAGTIDTDGVPHSAKVAWRALALLQEEEERLRGASLPPNARLPERHYPEQAVSAYELEHADIGMGLDTANIQLRPDEPETPELTPEQAALQERAEADEPSLGLNVETVGRDEEE